MKTKKNTGKIWAAVFIVALFLISSMVPVNAGLSDGLAGSIEKVKPVDSTTGTAEQNPVPTFEKTNNNAISTATNDVNLIGMQQEQLQGQFYQQPSQPAAKKYAVIMVGRYSGPTILSYLLDIPGFLEQANQSYVWFLNSAGMMYNTLHDTYGYDEDNIFLLVHLLPVITYQGKTYFNTIPTTFNPNWIDYDSNKTNLETVLSTFKPSGTNALNDQDQLFICFIDHGANEEENYFCNNEFISPSDRIDTNWVYEDKAYDSTENLLSHCWYHDTGTSAVFKRVKSGWSDPLILTFNQPKPIKGYRINAKKESHFDQMKVELYNGDTLVNTSIFTNWPDNGYEYKEFEDQVTVDKVKISFNLTSGTFFIHRAAVYDFNFWTAEWDNCGEVGHHTYFGCPFTTIPEYLRYLWSIIWGGYSSTEKLYDYELLSYMDGIKAKIIYALQPCMSGGFINELSADYGYNRIICTASRGCELAEASWIGPFIRALNKEYPEADLNGDGQYSILEAYKWAADRVADWLNQPGHEMYTQHPLIDDNGKEQVGNFPEKIGVGHHFSETNYYDPTDSTKDGYLAAHTFL
jgi:hypothetical protein